MDENNMTRITVIHLIGFQTPQMIKLFAFALLAIIYCVTICGNLLIISLVSCFSALHSPMYFFLSQLSVSDILLTTDILPNMLIAILLKKNTMSFSDCLTQFFFLAVSGILECFLLTVMCYDRYLAICKPLHYTVLMSHKLCWIMIITCWAVIILLIMILSISISKLTFCGPNIIDHFFCDFDPILNLSCSDTTIVQLESTVMNAVFVVVPFFIIIVSYAYIAVTIFKIPSITGRQKAFSTCSAHLTVVSIYFGTGICVYLVPSKGQSGNITKFLSLLYTVVTPLMNPIIYSLRNKELRKVVEKLISKSLNSHVSIN